MARAKVWRIDPATGTPGQVPTINPAGTEVEFADTGVAGHTHPTSDIVNLAEFIRDTIGATVIEGTGIDVIVDDAGNVVTVQLEFTSTAGEALVADGVTPPEQLTTEDATDFLYVG